MNDRDIAMAADTALNLIANETRLLNEAASRIGGRATALMAQPQLEALDAARRVIGKIKSSPAVMRALKKELPNG